MGRRRCNRKRVPASASEVGVILEAKKAWMEARAAEGSFLRRNLSAEEARDTPSPEEAKPSVAGRKRKKVVKTLLPEAAIKGLMAWHGNIVQDIPDDELAKRPKYFRDVYPQSKKTIEKMLAYKQALIDQYKRQGYAEDETEVTDDDEELVEN